MFSEDRGLAQHGVGRFEKPYKLASMNVTAIISEIDAQLDRLQQAKALLAPGSVLVHRKRASTIAYTDLSAKPAKKKRVLSPEARARIAEAQKKRWEAKREGKA